MSKLSLSYYISLFVCTLLFTINKCEAICAKPQMSPQVKYVHRATLICLRSTKLIIKKMFFATSKIVTNNYFNHNRL